MPLRRRMRLSVWPRLTVSPAVGNQSLCKVVFYSPCNTCLSRLFTFKMRCAVFAGSMLASWLLYAKQSYWAASILYIWSSHQVCTVKTGQDCVHERLRVLCLLCTYAWFLAPSTWPSMLHYRAAISNLLHLWKNSSCIADRSTENGCITYYW